jgi:ABC-type nitrate/sulfonate/bicarbonate transport system substrate-binding protein
MRIGLVAVVSVFVSAHWSIRAGAVSYVDARPLDQVVTAKPAPCDGKKPVQLPLITWGGDIPTIHANGNQATTAKGSLFDAEGLELKLAREDVFTNQLKAYMECKSPFLRATLAMLNLAAPVTEKDPRTKMTVIYQLTWSAGGDALVVKGGLKGPAELKGKTIALQAYGPHIDYLGKLLEDAGLGTKDVKIKWVKDLTGTGESPAAAFRESDVDAAIVILPDALALTSNGTVGTGAEDSVKGAQILLSTKSANRIIADAYAVRTDYFNDHKEEVKKLVLALLKAEKAVREGVRTKQGDAYAKTLPAAAQLLLDSAQATKDAEGMYFDAEFAGYDGNVKFFTDAKYPRNFNVLSTEIQTYLKALGLIEAPRALSHAQWDYSSLKEGADATATRKERFDADKVAKVVSQNEQQGTLGDGGLFAFEVFFKPNQNSFTADLYEKDFKKVINLAATYGGAIITIEGHSDPLAFLKQQKSGAPEVALTRVKQAAKNLSLTRANAVRDSLIKFASDNGVALDPSQFAVVGHGIARPRTGLCGADPCSPKTEQDWLSNMRVEFRIMQVEAEAEVFKPL